VRGDYDTGKSKLKSCEPLKNLFEAGNFGSISMKEASSDASREALRESSSAGFRFTNQLYEKLSIDRGCEVSMKHRMRGEQMCIVVTNYTRENIYSEGPLIMAPCLGIIKIYTERERERERRNITLLSTPLQLYMWLTSLQTIIPIVEKE